LLGETAMSAALSLNPNFDEVSEPDRLRFGSNHPPPEKGRSYVYELLYGGEGEGGGPFLIGLADTAKL
jgi:hypothetical protein